MSCKPFKIGDLVRVITPHSDLYNQECTITSNLRNAIRIKNNRPLGPVVVHDVDVIGKCGVCYGFTPDEIEHVYDGGEKGSWEDCVWKPDEELVT